MNKLVPAAAVMCGLKIVPMKRFLGLLSIDSQNADYMKKSSLDVLVRLANELFVAEMENTGREMLDHPEFDAGILFSYSFVQLIWFHPLLNSFVYFLSFPKLIF